MDGRTNANQNYYAASNDNNCDNDIDNSSRDWSNLEQSESVRKNAKSFFIRRK